MLWCIFVATDQSRKTVLMIKMMMMIVVRIQLIIPFSFFTSARNHEGVRISWSLSVSEQIPFKRMHQFGCGLCLLVAYRTDLGLLNLVTVHFPLISMLSFLLRISALWLCLWSTMKMIFGMPMIITRSNPIAGKSTVSVLPECVFVCVCLFLSVR